MPCSLPRALAVLGMERFVLQIRRFLRDDRVALPMKKLKEMILFPMVLVSVVICLDLRTGACSAVAGRCRFQLAETVLAVHFYIGVPSEEEAVAP